MIFKIPENASFRGLKLVSTTNVFVTPLQNLNQWVPAEFSRDDLSQAVSFFLDYINRIPVEQERKIGVTFGSLSFLSIAFMLALIKSKRHYIVFYHLDNFDDNLKNICNHLFIVGELPESVDESGLRSLPDFFSETWNDQVQYAVSAHTGRVDLEFEFSADQKTFRGVENKETAVWTAVPLYTTGKIEESCVAAAMDHYIHSDDVCILLRPFRHIGVATLSVYPALFKAKRIIICRSKFDWTDEYSAATNVHLAWEMVKENYPLPKKLRTVTTGGYAFNSECIRYVTDQSQVDNIIDCYGTAVCPPPLAIRQLYKDRPALQPFIWVNKFLTVEDHQGSLVIAGPAGVFEGVEGSVGSDRIKTNDHIELNGDSFYFYGSWMRFVRVNHERWTVDNFSSLLKEQTGISNFMIMFEKKDGVEVPSLYIEKQDEKVVAEFIKNVFAEISLDVDTN